MMSLALCVGVAFLLLAGSAFAGTTAVSGNVNNVALQSGKFVAVTPVVYTMPAGYSAAYTRTMAVARQVASGDFFLDVNLQNGFTFNAGRLPAVGDVTLTTAGGGAIGAITIFSGGTAGSSTVRFRIPVTTSFATAPVFTIATVGWTVNDTTGFLSGTTAVTTQIEIKTYDANTATDLDNGGVNTANFMVAVNALSAVLTPSTNDVIDVSAGSARTKFVPTAPNTLVQDNGASLNITVGNATAALNVHNNTGANYLVAATDTIKLTITGNLTGVKFVYYDTGGGAGNEVKVTVAAADVTNGFVVITVPGTNTTISALANASTGALPLTLEVDGTTQLTTRAFTIAVEATCAFNAANNRTGANALVVAGTPLTTWGINGSVLLFNWTSAKTDTFKSRMYIFNETSVANATVFVKIFQIPISSNTTAGVQVGNIVQLDKTLGAFSGMTIRLEDVIAAPAFGGTTAQLAGPDNSYNVAVEITVFSGVPATSTTKAPVTGYGQTFNAVGTPGVPIFGTVPLSIIQ